MKLQTRGFRRMLIALVTIVLMGVLVAAARTQDSIATVDLSQDKAVAPSTILVINVPTHEVQLYENGQPALRFPIATGTRQTPSPLGEFKIIEKARWGDGFGTRWMRLSVPWGQYGVHGTNKPWSIGSSASHGCFRMRNAQVEALFEHIPMGTRVYVVGPTPYTEIRRTLRLHAFGQDVVEAQRLLRTVHAYPGFLDGSYGEQMAAAVARFQRWNDLPITGELDRQTLQRLEEQANELTMFFPNGKKV